MEDLALSIDIGGTNIKYGLVSRGGDIQMHQSVKTNDFQTVDDFARALWHDEIIQAHFSQIVSIGIGVPNADSYNGTIDNAPNLPWKGKIQLKQIFQNTFQLPTIIANDANAAAVGEKMFGNGKKFKNFIEITLGTGLGSGIISNGELLLGNHSLAGEFGHFRVVSDGRQCNCGRKGCLERYASATGIVDTFELLKNQFPDSSLHQFEKVTTKEIFDAYLQKDQLSEEIVRQTVDVLGNALADFACFSDPEAYIFFGGMIRTDNDFLDRIKQVMEENILNIYKDKIVVLPTGLSANDAALLGAAAMAFTLL